MENEKSAISPNVISLPDGGGAMKGMGETFSADLFSGTGNFSVPISVPKGRQGMEPRLSIDYSTGNGNGICGQGWDVRIPGIQRKTSLGVPRYRDQTDTFVLSGAEDLIPVKETTEEEDGVFVYKIGYRPRTEGIFSKITHIKGSDGRNFWEVKTKDGKTSFYGNPDPVDANSARLTDPEDTSKVFQWRLFRTFDLMGNEVVYEYISTPPNPSDHPFSCSYLKVIHYADYDKSGSRKYLCSVKMNYEERPDVFSSYTSGFEIRNTLRLRNIETYTHPSDSDLPDGYSPEPGGNSILVKRFELTYRDQTEAGAPSNGVSLLLRVQVEGHGPDGPEPMPPVEFGYTEFELESREFKTLNESHLPLLSLADPSMDLVDLDGNGLPDLVEIVPGQPIRYWKNRGRGKFDHPRMMKDAPLGMSMEAGAAQFMDADGDGRADLVVNTPHNKGYFPLRPDGHWDAAKYVRYETVPSVDFASHDVKYMDLTGDGRTDLIVNGDRAFDCYFQNSPLIGKPDSDGTGPEEPGWSEKVRVRKKNLGEFPEINFADPRIRTADLSGDGLQDIVMITSGGVFYWPNLGYGNFGAKRSMGNSPRPGFDFDPDRVILADINGDGLTDYIYINVNSVDYYINQSGKAWGEKQTVRGTPRFTSRNAIRVVDLMGTGTPGLLWSYNAGENRNRFYFFDLTKGQKPFLLNEVNNNLGAVTRVHYAPSTEFYLRDLYGKSPEEFPFVESVGPWKTTLPFPVLTVSKVEAIDQISNNKLITRYFYHHGCWDGVEREFRGFGRVDQFDTETFASYNDDQLVLGENFEGVTPEEYVPPVYTKNWFHLGPVQKPDGDWGEMDYSGEYWSGDPNMLNRPTDFNAMLQTLTRRGRRDALRTLRGSALRSEFYAKDGSPIRTRPYSVKETQTSAKFIDGPGENPVIKALGTALNSNCIFFSFQYASRESIWERGEEPKTTFSFTGEVDAYGQALESLSIAVPRGKDPLTGGELPGAPVYDPTESYLAVLNKTDYAYKDESVGLYFVDRVKQTRSEEITGTAAQDVFTIRDNAFSASATTRILSHQINYYDGNSFTGEDYGVLGSYGLLVRSEFLMVTPQELTDAHGSHVPPPFSAGNTPDWSGYPQGFVNGLRDQNLGYIYYSGTGGGPHMEGYYAPGAKMKYDIQTTGVPSKGLVLAQRNVYDDETEIAYDTYWLSPIRVTDPAGMTVNSEIDYRLLVPRQVTDSNDNVSKVVFNALGLVSKIAVCGKIDAQGQTQGDTLAVPGTIFEYDFFAFMDAGDPISVRKTVREHHINAPYLSSLPPADRNATISSADYSDGYGRIVQSRAQAEDVIYGDEVFGDSGLPADQAEPNAPAVGTERDAADPLNVVVSGKKRYNNKGEVVAQYEPYFASGFDYEPDDSPAGVAVKMYYDALGRMTRTVNPDGSEQRIVFGIPDSLDTPDEYTRTPWERYHYSPNDLGGGPHKDTPKSESIDALGNVIQTTEHLAFDNDGVMEDVVMKYRYDIKGQLTNVFDPYLREIFTYTYDTSGKRLRSYHLDSGVKTAVIDALNLPAITQDAKGAGSLFSYDHLLRPTFIRSRDGSGQPITLRQVLRYGDSSGLTNPEDKNLNGQLYQHFDEAGKLTYTDYDFKGNLLNHFRQIITDAAPTPFQKYVVDWANFNPAHLSSTQNTITREYDALDRVRRMQYPEDRQGQRKLLVPSYNKGGALQALSLASSEVVTNIAYNAKGQRILLALRNGIMTRYAYDDENFRLKRTRSEKFTQSGHTYTPNGGVQQDLAYTYDLEGTITSINDEAPATNSAQGPGSLLKQFTHDPLRRLLTATGRESSNVYQQPGWDLNIRPQDYTATNAYSRTYQYDKLGNIKELKHVAQGDNNQNFVRSYNYSDFTTNRLKDFSYGGNTYGYDYDACGNIIKEADNRYYEWSSNDKMAVFKNQSGGSQPTVYTNYFYNAAGERVQKQVRKGSSIEVTFYMGGGLFETSYVKPTGGSIDNNRFYNTLHVLDGTSRIASLRVGNDADDPTPAAKFYLEDQVMNSLVVLTATGNLINREEFYPFGETSFGGYAKKRYRYNGKEKDSESGLYYYGQRYYAPWVCRFVSVDSVTESFADLSSYNYAGNRPVTKIDQEGLQEKGRKKTPNNKEDNRVRESGRNIKDGKRTNQDVNYEMHNLPENPVGGQKVSYHYTQGEQRQADWVYNQESDSWGLNTMSFQDIRDGIVKEPSSFWLPARHSSENIDSHNIPTAGDFAENIEKKGEVNNNSGNQTVESSTENESVISSINEMITSDDGNSVVAITDILNSAVESAAKDAQDFKPKYRHSNPNVNAPVKLNRLMKFTGFASKFLGVTSMYQHVQEAKEYYQRGDKINVTISSIKILIDLGFTLAKANPVILGLSIGYNVLDMGGFLKW